MSRSERGECNKRDEIIVPCNLFHQARTCPYADHEVQGHEGRRCWGIGNRSILSETSVTYMVRDTPQDSNLRCGPAPEASEMPQTTKYSNLVSLCFRPRYLWPPLCVCFQCGMTFSDKTGVHCLFLILKFVSLFFLNGTKGALKMGSPLALLSY